MDSYRISLFIQTINGSLERKKVFQATRSEIYKFNVIDSTQLDYEQ